MADTLADIKVSLDIVATDVAKISARVAAFDVLPPPPPPPPPPPDVPPAAVAVGYTKRVFGPTLTLDTNWFKVVSAATATQNADGSITTSGGGNSYAAQLQTAKPTGQTTWTGSTWAGGAYFEYTMSFKNPPVFGSGWPSLWITDMEKQAADSAGNGDSPLTHWQGQAPGFFRTLTLNVAEWANDHTAMPSSRLVYHEASDFYNAAVWSQTQTGYNANGSPYALPAAFDLTKPNRYGALWVPATATSRGYFRHYINDIRVDTGLAEWDLFNPAAPPPPVLGKSAFSFADARHLEAGFGTGPGNPLTVHAFSVWQSTTPPPEPPPPLVESADGATITTVGPKLVILGVSWELTTSATSGLQLMRNGTLQAGTAQVNLVLRFADKCSHRNSASNWYTADAAGIWTQVTGDPRQPAPPPPPPPPVTGIPAQAVAVGYTHIVLDTDFTSASEIADWGSSVIAPWYTGGSDGRYTNIGDSSIANSVLTFNTARVGYAANISSVRGGGAPTTRPGAIVSGNTSGRLYQYGYYEAKMRSGNVRHGPGWPAWWATALGSAPGDHLEVDFMESQSGLTSTGGATAGFLHWFDGVNDPGSFGQFFGALGATGYPNWSTVIQQSGIDLVGGWNVFGFLWTPTYIEMYWNSWARRQAGIADYRHSRYPTTTPLRGFISNDSSRPATVTLTSANASVGLYLILGSGTGDGTQIDYVRVWQ